MAPIKFEDNIREKLEERELRPSSNAWEKLEAQLPEEEKGSRSFLWLAIAASFIGILVVGSLIFNSSNNSVLDNEIVVEETETDNQNASDEHTEFVQPEIQEKIQDKINPIQIASEEKQEVIKPKQQQPKPQQNQKQVVLESENAVAQLSNTQQEKQKINSIDVNNELVKKQGIINSKINEVVAQVQALEKENTSVTAKEIDALLAQAQREIATQRILNATTIDAAALLDDVESDLERSFRDKVFDALGDSYSKIRTAVVERNN